MGQQAIVESSLVIERVEPTEVAGVYHLELRSLEESPIISLEVELPKQILLFTRGERVKVGLSPSPIPWGQDADLYMSARAFGVKQAEGGVKVYASAGGLQIRAVLREGPQPFKPLDKLYLAIKALREE